MPKLTKKMEGKMKECKLMIKHCFSFILIQGNIYIYYSLQYSGGLKDKLQSREHILHTKIAQHKSPLKILFYAQNHPT